MMAIFNQFSHPRFPVDRKTYDESIALLESAVSPAQVDPAGRDRALFRLTHWLDQRSRQ